jgi:hypothetical protein
VGYRAHRGDEGEAPTVGYLTKAVDALQASRACFGGSLQTSARRAQSGGSILPMNRRQDEGSLKVRGDRSESQCFA